ncbi:hypothetical protein Tco_0893638 [Tanacetum coccineum]|uniref:Uncharacterized protein n=1 Tax=Tanacetum coccineum TaxID=301880 RepID=A0ABQ5CCP6_9ASTR
MAGLKPKDLKNKIFDSIQKLFDKAMKRVNTFVDMDIELVEGSEVKAEESTKKKKIDNVKETDEVDEDKETVELQSLMKVIHDEEEVAVDAIPLATKPPSIVDWKILKEGNISYYQIIRAEGSSKRRDIPPTTITEMLNKKLQADHSNEMCYQLLKLMTKQLQNQLSGRIVEIKRLLDDLRVTAAKLMLLVYKLLLLVFRVNAIGTKLQLLKDYNC